MPIMFYRFHAVVLLGAIWSTGALAAGFDCSTARSNNERLICTTPELSDMDDDLNYLYRHLAIQDGATREKTAQRRWLRQRDICGADFSCTRAAYIHRISTLLESRALTLPEQGKNSLERTKVRLKSGWIVDDPGDAPPPTPCAALRDYMNTKAAYWWRTSSNQYYSYCSAAAQQSPFLTTPPWRKLIPEQHRPLIAKLLRLRDEGSFRYFKGAHRRDEAYYREQTEKFIADGSILEFWTGHFFDAVTDAYTAESVNSTGRTQHLVQLGLTIPEAAALPYRSRACDSPKKRFSQYLVTENLEDPEPVFVPELDDAVVVLYQNRIAVLSSGEAHVDLTFPDADSERANCKLRFIKK